MAHAPARPEIAAAIDIGSYSVHLLVAEISGEELRVRHDESAHLGLGRTIDADGGLGTARELLRDTIVGFANQARGLGAGAITVAATDPFRRASDARDAVNEVWRASGIEIVTLSHEEEALLALLGVQEGRPVTREQVMIDVGGGSTEILVAAPERAPVAVGLPLGAARLTGVHIQHDPPIASEIEGLRAEVSKAMERAPESDASQLVAVGGTARNLLRIGPPLANRILTESRIRNALDAMMAVPAATIAEQHGVRLSRARVLAAGASILLGALEHYGADRLRVATGGLREGLIFAAYQAGPSWRAHIGALAQGWQR
jgi:exopolyphosphatase / guanosine-5'-triphosphate,3'-diphosphate pyrophosphatase